MRLILAPDSFKQSLPAHAVADAMADGIRDALDGRDFRIDRCPIADGGEGTLDAIVAAANGRWMRSTVTGPLGDPVEARWAICDDGRLGVIEMAEAAGLALVPDDQRDPTRTTTYGVGELIAAALDAGCDRMLIGIGGSATCDGGIGMMQSLGAACCIGDERIDRPIVGADLIELTRIDPLPALDRLARCARGIDVACDVTNPLFGPDGAAAVYGPQKGATPEQVASLDAGLRHLASLVPHPDPHAPGAGAAGGIGFTFGGLLGARLRSGVDLVLDAVGFDDRVTGADLVVTGEGRLDATSASGKACVGVARAAARRGVPTVAVVGSLAADADPTACGFADVAALCDGSVSFDEAMADTANLVRIRTAQLVTRWLQSCE